MSDLSEFVTNAARAAGYEIDLPRGGGRKALAEAAGMSHASVGRVLSGKTNISPEALPGLATALDVPISSLLVAAGFVKSPGDLTDLPAQASSGTAPVSAEVIAQLRAIRNERKVSAQELADRMTAAGYPIKRSVIANLESGRRAEVSVDHLAIAAKALGVDPAAILRRVAAPCPHCTGQPPAGFTCNTCGTAGGAA
jgi:transcriptional regulator with XRE-family HTH domain